MSPSFIQSLCQKLLYTNMFRKLGRNCFYIHTNYKKLFKQNHIILNKLILSKNRVYCTKETSKPYNRHCYNSKVELLVNEQINVEFSAAYSYLSMANYYARSDVALPGLHGFFMKMYYEEQDHALKFVKYQTMRGGLVKLLQIDAPEKNEFADVAKCMNTALDMEKTVKEKIVNIYRIAEQIGDTNVMDYLDSFVESQEHSICEISRLYTRASELTKCELGRYLFDRELHETHVKKDPAQCTTQTADKLYR